MTKRFYHLFILICMAGCSGGESGDFQAAGKNLALKVSGSRSFNPDIVHGQIDYYQITITAPDLKIPFTQRFEGKTSNASLLGIPSGADRTILVEAVNPNGLVIRRGKKEGVVIMPGQVSKAEISMVAVPIFTNIADRSAVASSRLAFEIFAEPGSPLQVFEGIAEAQNPLIDRSSGKTWVDTQMNDEGVCSLAPPPLAVGTHVFEVRDAETGEFSRITVGLYRQTVRPGIGVNSGGTATNQGDELVLRGVGQPYYSEVTLGDEGLATFLDVVEMLY